MSYHSWQDLLDEEEPTEVRSDPPGVGEVLAAPVSNARTAELDRLEATCRDDDALAALIAEQRAIEARVAVLGTPAGERPGRWGARFQRTPETPESRAERRNQARLQVEDHLEQNLARARELARGREALAVPERPTVGDASWRLAARTWGTPAWERRQALLESAALERRLDERPRVRVQPEWTMDPADTGVEREEPPLRELSEGFRPVRPREPLDRAECLDRPEPGGTSRERGPDLRGRSGLFRERTSLRERGGSLRGRDSVYRGRNGAFRERDVASRERGETSRAVFRERTGPDRTDDFRERVRTRRTDDEPRVRGRSSGEPRLRDRFDD